MNICWNNTTSHLSRLLCQLNNLTKWFELQYFCGFIARAKMMKSLELEALWTFIMAQDEVQILYTLVRLKFTTHSHVKKKILRKTKQFTTSKYGMISALYKRQLFFYNNIISIKYIWRPKDNKAPYHEKGANNRFTCSSYNWLCRKSTPSSASNFHFKAQKTNCAQSISPSPTNDCWRLIVQ